VLLCTGMALLALALIWPRFLLVTGGLGPDAIDGVRGFLIGLSIGLNLWAVRWISAARRRCGNGA
jgi:hypothetical protein